MHVYQGSLDGLCGAYAITNAVWHCGVSDQENIFRHACAALPKHRWPHVLWDGTHFADLQKMAKRCLLTLGYDHIIRTTSPFVSSPPKNNTAYWRAFDELFDDSTKVQCAILGLNRPSLHWIVAFRDGGRISFIDSNPVNPILRKNKSSVFAGKRNSNKNTWLIDPTELLLFETQ